MRQLFFRRSNGARAQDASLLLSGMAGKLSGRPVLGWRAAGALRGARLPHSAAGLRIPWIGNFGRYRTHPEMARLTIAAVRGLEGQGASVEESTDPCFEDLFGVYTVIASSAHAGRYGGLAERWHDQMTPSMLDSIAKGTRWSAVDLYALAISARACSAVCSDCSSASTQRRQ